FRWAVGGNEVEEISKKTGLAEERIDHLQTWADKKLESNKIGWQNTFYTLEELQEYKQAYFKNRDDLVALGLSFPETEMEDLVTEFKPKIENGGEIGIRYALRQRKPENSEGIFIGYDIIGVELSGTFHTIHCHDLQDELTERFGLEFHENGLVKSCENWKEVTDFCNDESNGLEPVPWFYCRVKTYG
ncbi:MAG: hypothetical protein AAGI38_22310, partial [Bacteroidota bacterium]